ncbi:hypothetical protein, partial [Agromyces allii]|uniref:hypothetical protein n=1 Tax=Agromyces allii TaxID=393607 RepID=UPI0031D07855
SLLEERNESQADSAAPHQNPWANRAKSVALWALGVGIPFWIAPVLLLFVPSAQVQAIALLVFWTGFLPVLVLITLSIVFGSIGLRRSKEVDGLGRSASLTSLRIGVGLILVPPVLGFVLGMIVYFATR